jgi:hypothetical protein
MTEAQYQKILSRLTALENKLNDVTTAMNNYMTNLQISEIYTILSAETTALRDIVEALTTRVETIEEEPYEDID